MPNAAVLAQLLGLWLVAGATSWAWFVAAGLRFEERGARSVESQGAAFPESGVKVPAR